MELMDFSKALIEMKKGKKINSLSWQSTWMFAEIKFSQDVPVQLLKRNDVTGMSVWKPDIDDLTTEDYYVIHS